MIKKLLKKYRNSNVKVLIILIIVLLSIPVTITLSRYVSNFIKSFYFESKNFYFSSDKLTEKNPTYIVKNWSGVDDFNIQFNLEGRKNNILKTTSDIEYEIFYQCDNTRVICSSNSSSGIIYSTISTVPINIKIRPKVSFQDNEKTIVYISAKSKKPYVKTISASFVIEVGRRGVSYNIEDEGKRAYLIFSLTNAISAYKVKTAFLSFNVGDELTHNQYLLLSDIDKKKCYSLRVKLKFDPKKIILDTTTNILKNATTTTTNINNINYINSISFEVDALSSLKLRFYKINTSDNYTYPNTNNNSVIEFQTS